MNGVLAKTYYAARGDFELRSLNYGLGELPLTLDAFVDFRASRLNDGVSLSIFYSPSRPLFLQTASPDDGAWFVANGFADWVDLIFSAPLDKGSILTGSFTWRWTGGDSPVVPAAIAFTEQDRQLRILKPSLPPDYVGSLDLSFADLDSADTDPMVEPVTLHYDITDTGSMKSQPGATPFTRPTVTGVLSVGRMVVTRGLSVERMTKSFIEQKGLTSEKVLKVLQIEGPNNTLEIFLLWWKETAPKVLSLSPKPSATIPIESPSDTIILQFDQAVLNPKDYGTFDGVLLSDVAFTVVQMDDVGRQWRLSKSGGLFATAGQHTLKISGLPNEFGDLPGPPVLFSWQVQALQPVAGPGGTTELVASVQGSWQFNSSPAPSDPGYQRFKANHVTPALVTALYFNDTSNENFDVGTLMGFLSTGDRIYSQQKTDASRAILFIVTGPPVDNVGWWTVPVGVLESATIYQHGQDCGFAISFASNASLSAYQLISEKNAPSGYAGVDSGGIVQPQIQFIAAGLMASRPAASIPGRVYFSTDTKDLWIVKPV